MATKNHQTDHNSFVMYKDWGKHFDMLEDDELGRLIRAVYAYVKGEQTPDIKDRAVSMLFNMMKDCFDRDGEKWEEIRNIRKENGAKGGAPKGNQNASKTTKTTKTTNRLNNQPKQAVNDNVTVNDSVSETDNETDNDSVTDIVSETDSQTIPETKSREKSVSQSVSQSVGQSVGQNNISEKKQGDPRNQWHETTSTDFGRVGLTDAERKDLAKRCSESIVDNYIRKIRDWQIKNHKLNACPFITIGKWIEEDRGKSIYGGYQNKSNQSNQSNSSLSVQRYKGNNGKPIYESGGVIRNLNIATMTSEEYDAYAASIDLSKVTT